MARPASSEGDQFSLFQQLLSAATRPSPIKVMFGRDELEVSYLCELSVSFLFVKFKPPFTHNMSEHKLKIRKACGQNGRT